MGLPKAIILFGISLSSFFAAGQTVAQVEKMEQEYQARLDTGADMLRDTKRYYVKMDSMLNVVYWKLYYSTKPAQRPNLKSQQIRWLKSRDNFFKAEDRKFSAKYDSGEWGTDMEMISYDSKARFVQKRVIALIKKLP